MVDRGRLSERARSERDEGRGMRDEGSEDQGGGVERKSAPFRPSAALENMFKGWSQESPVFAPTRCERQQQQQQQQ